MKFVWAGDRNERYSLRVFSIKLSTPCDKMVLFGADFYQVFLDGEFSSYGPERTAEGYARERVISLSNTKEITIKVSGYNHQAYCVDRTLPFFGAEVFSNGKLIYTSLDFSCYTPLEKELDVSRFSGQRTGLEVYDFTKSGKRQEEIYEVDSPKVLKGIGDMARYERVNFNLDSMGDFNGFYNVMPAFSEFNPVNLASEKGFLVQRDFIDKTKSGYKEINYSLDRERTGFISLKINAKTETEIFIVTDEFIDNGNWVFRRSGCNDLIYIKTQIGKRSFLSFEPYAFKYLKIVYKGEADFSLSLITLENGYCDKIKVSGSGKLFSVYSSAKATFEQNAIDIFTDCPGRERAGWLCDSFFTARAEKFFTGKNIIERAFLENIIISKTPELDYRMIPKSFPSESNKDHYIPNWAMWFVVELKDYLERTGDRTLIDMAKERVYNLLDFFSGYENEFSLLEDLESWVFIEWSVCNKLDYVKGVNFPSNILYAAMLEAVDIMYGDSKAKEKAKVIKENVIKLSFDGEFFADNAVREDGKLIRCDEHLSETCQYYALFFKIIQEEKFIEKMIEKFGPFRGEKEFMKVGKSAPFIGNYLRLYFLLEKGEKERVKKEITEYFYPMAKKTGTLWEHNDSRASCNHGFASVTAELIVKALYGEKEPKDNHYIIEE